MKAIFFDANGVLYYRKGKNQRLTAFLHQYGLALPKEESLKESLDEIHDRALRGEVSQQAYEEAILLSCGLTDPELIMQGHLILSQEHADILLFPGSVNTLQTLKERGFKLGIITDAAVPKETKLSWLKAGGLDIAWDAYANSKDLRVRKPHLRMYQEAMRQAGVGPSDSTFVGHDAHELDGARTAGMVTVAFNYESGIVAEWYVDHFSDLLQLPFLQEVS